MKPGSMRPAGGGGIDWEGALWDCIAHLQALIRMDTVNPPGREMGVARYLDDVLRGAGISTTLLEPAPGRAALVGRLQGAGHQRPVMLVAHMDVVGVERAKWQTNPFGAEILDGFVYGRGAIDDKGMLAVNLQTMLLLNEHVKESGGRLDRDVIFLATSDEEAGGRAGIGWVLENHPDLVDAEFALNEGGRVREVDGRLSYAAVQCAEKVPCVLQLVASGIPGHASIPIPDNAVVRLARALAAVGSHREPVVMTELARRYFNALAEITDVPRIAAAMKDVASDEPARVTAGAGVLESTPRFDAILRNGITPTMLEAGVRSNVIPGQATATLNVRLLPGEHLEDLIGRLVGVIADPQVEVRVHAAGEQAPESAPEGPLFEAIEASMATLAPGVPVLPFLSTGATDSAPLRRAGVMAYGLLPFPLTEADENRMHGNDERVAVSSIDFAVRLTYDVIQRLAAGA